MAEYLDEDNSDWDFKKPILTRNKDEAEKEIKDIEATLRRRGETMSEKWKERIRKRYQYIGK